MPVLNPELISSPFRFRQDAGRTQKAKDRIPVLNIELIMVVVA